MERFTLSVRRFRQLAIVTTASICVLVVAGGVVRLTGSGLGCDDWPNCNDTRFIDVSTGHTAIEQINRIFSGLIGIPVLAMAVGSFRVRPARPGLRWPSIGVLITVLANGVVGGIAVRRDLHPALVQSHFLLAMASIALGLIAIDRARAEPIGGGPVSRGVGALVLGLSVLTASAIVTGTVVTGTGPHAGEEDVRRFGFDISGVARIHSLTVLLAASIAVVLLVAVVRRPELRPRIGSALTNWTLLAVVQGAIGYVQYFNDVPELLVGAHIAGATALWVMTVRLVLDAFADRTVSDTSAPPSRSPTTAAPVG
jgi:cytochrome c oxidase assembly protein subunit 15